MSMMTDEEYEKLDKSEWRVGQTAFNNLRQYEPEIANKIWGTSADPFFTDSVLPLFYQRTEEMRKANV